MGVAACDTLHPKGYPMHHVDIQLAISRKTLSDLEDAFLALTIAGWNKIVTAKGNEISDTEKRNLLGQVCEVLEGDDRIMPGDACAQFDLPAGGAYADAVAHVRAHGWKPV